ncbi:two-component system, chemotaxis family, sensor kinase CheA [Paenibacillus catalpae]|uniref:Circadian input-output histidine kinase CikA n=1 Tax=Paenibacillus catalpae TaxID=1045775 RepID=A0A1I2GMH5_9BACL|nr:ATP-binding protein [Paenibacillus catalpae]SFF18047.1 two-component system, chemotaxis family, sensor kinase CheA [Paenibacillus catalpae]
MRFTIRSKLLISFLSVAFFVTAVNITAYIYNDKLNRSFDELIDRRVAVLSKATEIQYLSVQQTNSLRGYLLTQDSDFLTELRSSNTQMTALVDEVDNLIIKPDVRESFRELANMDEAFIKSSDQLLLNLEKDQDQEAALAYFKTTVLPIGEQLGPLSMAFVDHQQQLLDEERADNASMVDFVNTMTAVLTVITFLLTLLIGILLSHRITSNLFKITSVIKGFTHDSNTASKLPHIDVRSQDEIGDIARSFNEMALTLNKYSILEEDQRWLETNVAEMATKFQGVNHLEALAQLFITRITPLVEASYGVFYLKEGAGRRQQLNKLASYAYQQSSVGVESFKTGEGLVGQAALESRTILLNNLPDNYIQITSGLGKAAPASLLIMPIQFEGQVVAVIELASFSPFTPIQQTLVQQASAHLGSVLSSISGRMQVEQLLAESQVLTEELQTQSEELRGINEKLEEQYKNSEQKTRELEKTQTQLEEKARQLSQSSQYKSEFLANMSHELRTPLNSLLILSNILATNAEGNLNEHQVKYANTIHHSGNDLLQLINDILDLAKVEAGKMDLVHGKVCLHEISGFAEQQFTPVARQKGLKFTTILDPDLPEAIFTDEQRLLQIIKNLLSNAFKFTERGEVKLHIHRAAPPQAGIAFSITDTGIGIPKEKQELIFQAFQQADGTTNRRYGGTGLGLSISINMAHLLNGEIIVSSTVGKGSVFSLVVPNEEEAESGAMVHQESAAAAAEPEPEIVVEARGFEDELDDAVWVGKKILIVDDDMRNIYATTIALESKQVNVLFAENGLSCLKVLKDNPDVDLILMDIMLPEMDGYETMRTLRQMPGFVSLPIIALTAKAMKDDKDKCIEAGASDYMSKPVKLEQLFARIHSWLSR